MKSFACYLHKPGVITPEIRFITVDEAAELPEAVSHMLSTWPHFETLEVMDEDGEPFFRIGPEQGAATQ